MLSVTFGFADGETKIVSFSEAASAATQTSIIHAVAGYDGAFVSLSRGTFNVTGTGKSADGVLRVGSDTTFAGAGAGQTFVKLADGSSGVTGIVRTDSGETLSDGGVQTTENVTIKNLTIDGNRTKTVGDTDGFYCGPKPNSTAFDHNIMVDGVEVKNVSRYGFDPHEQTIGLTFQNSVAHHNGADGFTIDYSSDVTLINNQAYANGRHGFNVVTSSSDVQFIDNDAWGNGGSGVVVQTGDNELRAFTSDVSIVGGTYFDNGRAGIEVRQSMDVSISGATVAGNFDDGIILSGVSGATLQNNALSGNGGTIRIEGLLQDFADSDVANDRFIPSTQITIDGVRVPDTVVPGGAVLFTAHLSSGDDTKVASNGRDAVAAGDGADSINAMRGNDVIYGEGGNDRVNGGTGSDVLHGNDGNDWLSGDQGWDTLSGGRGADVFAFAGRWGTDTVTDFQNGRDTFDVSAVVGLDAFSQLSIKQAGADVRIGFGDDFIVAKNIAAADIDASDFVF
jgi:parallel beta-helix repeat protein